MDQYPEVDLWEVISAALTVDDFVTVRASKFNTDQRSATSSVQQVQYHSVKNYQFQSISITCKIWFGTRCSAWNSLL
jgi:hypothetical protein